MRYFLEVFTGLVVIGLTFFLGFVAGVDAKTRTCELKSAVVEETLTAEHAKAVEAHVGYYALNAQTGKVEFVYLDVQGLVNQIMSQMHTVPMAPRQ